jgi:hypothetical protein
MGYSRDKKGYRYFDPVKKRMYESTDMTFCELESYFSFAGVPTSPSTVLNTSLILFILLV